MSFFFPPSVFNGKTLVTAIKSWSNGDERNGDGSGRRGNRVNVFMSKSESTELGGSASRSAIYYFTHASVVCSLASSCFLTEICS